MIRKFLARGTCCICLLFMSYSVSAGPLYRFPDENGVLTLSRSLPPEAAQKGYDVLDDKSMRLIERVAPAPTADEIAEIEAQKVQAIAQQKQAKIDAKLAEEQARVDRTLLITYPTEQDLINARDKDLAYREEQIKTYQSKLPILQKNLEQIQKEAAEHELSGGKITPNMQKRLDAAHEEIAVRKLAIEKYQAEVDALSAQYEAELNRLRQLLNKRASQ